MDIRKNNTGDSDRLIKAAYPGKLENQRDLIAWSQSLRKYLSTILGQNEYPLIYFICENPYPNYGGEDDED